MFIGESYAGHFIPSFGRRIYDGNNNLQPNDLYINLKGLAIGDGLVDPYNQYPGYPEYAIMNDLVSETQYHVMKDCLPLCEEEIKLCNDLNDTIEAWTACLNAYDTCNICEITPVTISGKYNPYDIREPCNVEPLCYNFTNENVFYNLDSTMKGLGVDQAHVKKWIDCNRFVELGLVFAGDWMKDFADDIAILLGDGKQILVYFGIWDYVGI